jgi:hypothetical protein
MGADACSGAIGLLKSQMARKGFHVVPADSGRFEKLAQSVTSPSRKRSLRLRAEASVSKPHLNTLLMVSQMLRSPAPVSAVISLKSFMCASVAGPAIPSATSPFFC